MSAANQPAAGPAIAAVVDALGLERPEVTELAGGAANRSFRLRDSAHDLVLRLAGTAAAGLGASVRSEVAMQALAAGAGLAPAVVLADAVRGYVVSRYAEGRTPGAAGMRDPRLLRRVGAWIARLHALPPPAGLPVVDIGERAAGYLAQAEQQAADESGMRLTRSLAVRRAALAPPVRIAACHHDLHHRNFLDDGRRLVAVDWEYAGPGDPAADLACCIGYHDLDDAAVEALLDGYGNVTAGLRARVAALAWIFDCLWYGWNCAAALAGLEPDPNEQARLAARLAR